MIKNDESHASLRVVSWWAWWPDTFWHGRWSPISLRPALSESSESHLRSSSCRATRPGRTQRERPTSPPAVASELHSSGKSGDAGRRQPRGSLPHHDRRGAGALRQICAASPSRPVRRVTVVGRRALDGVVCRAAAVTAGLPSAPGSVRPGRC